MAVRRTLLGAVTMLVLTMPATASAQGVLDATCPPPPDTQLFGGVNGRTAQTFTAQASGALTRVEYIVTKGGGTSGDYIFQIAELDGGGVPTNTVLASTTIPNASVPNGESTVSGVFATPATVVAGQRYALVATRPGPDTLVSGLRTGDDCPGAAYSSTNQTNPFSPGLADWDVVFAVFVDPPAPPDTAPPETSFTATPKGKTRKRAAAFEFASSEPGSTFACSLDGAAFEPCASPKTYDKLKRKKHSFAVVATDAAGNTDPTPATFDWKVKRKRR